MAAISFSTTRGVDGFKISDFTFGTLAPNAGDVEFRFNTTDTNSAVLTRKDLVQILEAFTRVIESGPIFTTTPVL
jgi:hypothetical protein